MGNIQANDKQSKTGKSPAKGKHFIRNLNRKSSGRENKKHARKKSDAKRDAIDREFDKTPDSDINEPIETSDNDMVECVFKTLSRQGESAERPRVHSSAEVTVTRCSPGPRSPTRARSPAAARSPADDSTSESVFTDPLTPLAVELNQCYYSAESDSAPDDLPRTLTPSPAADAHAHPAPPHMTVDMPQEEAASPHASHDIEKEEKNDVFDDSDKGENEKVMGKIFSGLCGGNNRNLERTTHECNHDFRDNRLKGCAEQTSFTLSKYRKVELPPVACEPSLTLLDNVISEKDTRRHSSVSDVPVTESNVLRKVASLTLDKLTESKVVRPKFVPDKLDFKLYEKFEGQMLLNWFISSITENKHLKTLLSVQDLRNLGTQYCTHLLAAGVLRQISDKDAPTENIFKPNLMYYWAHMEVPTLQPITPGRLNTSMWPPDKDSLPYIAQDNQRDVENNKFFTQNNNEEISDINEAKVVISQLKKKLQDLEFQLEKYTISSQIESLNKNLEKFEAINDYNKIKIKAELKNREVQTSQTSELNKLSNKPVINIPEYDPLRKNVHIDNAIDLSSLDYKNEVARKPDVRSDKVVNYCKLNKSREYIKSYRNDDLSELKDIPNVDYIQINKDGPESEHSLCSSDASFVSTCTSNDCITNVTKSSLEIVKSDDNTLRNEIPDNEMLCTSSDSVRKISIQTSQTTLELCSDVSVETETKAVKECSVIPESLFTSSGNELDKEQVLNISQAESETTNEAKPFLPPPLPGMSPPPPPMPGTTDLAQSKLVKSDIGSGGTISPNSHLDSLLQSLHAQPAAEAAIGELSSLPANKSESSHPQTTLEPLPAKADIIPPPPPMSGLGPPPPPMAGMSPGQPLVSNVGPPPPPMPGMGPPPPPMPGMGPPPPPMPGMGHSTPPLSGMGPPPPPMPSIGPPPPPMPGMGPPPPPMPGMGPPPPTMPGMGPPPPPMPGMGPPPPPMPGIGPPAPPMPGMGPPPPPHMPGVGPMPPPPPSGPVPFPAPPVGGWNVQRATLRKTPVKPAAPMKPLYWTRILAAPPSSAKPSEPVPGKLKPLWLEIEEASLDNIDEFTDLFSRQVVKAPVKKKVEVKTKIQPVKILDSKRSQNVGILAQSLHVEFSEIENAIYNFDTSVVSLEALHQIYELRATEEELSMIKEHLKNKSDVPLDRPEAFLHDLSGIPNFAERISCFMFQAEFEDAVSTTMHKLDNLKHTCEFLATSEPLKKLFAIILTLGNYMNGGNGQRGQADGFGLEILAKLKDVKSKQSTVTLLHFIVRTYMRASGGALAESCALPVPEPGDVLRAADTDFADVAATLGALGKQLNACKEKMKKVIDFDANTGNLCDESSPDESKRRLDVFKEKMTAFVNAAEEKLKTENENLEECRSKFIATVKFYQYSPKCGKLEDCEPKEFFSLWTSFCIDFKDIYKKEEQIAIKEKLKEAKKLQEERKPLTQPKKEGGLKARLQKLSSTRK